METLRPTLEDAKKEILADATEVSDVVATKIEAVKEIFTDLVPFAVVDNIVQRSGAETVVQDAVQLTGNIT